MEHVGAGADRGDYASKCDHCQVPKLRSELHRDAMGLLRCDEHDGREPIELDQANAASAKDIPMHGPNDGGQYKLVDNAGLETLEAKLATLGTP